MEQLAMAVTSKLHLSESAGHFLKLSPEELMTSSDPNINLPVRITPYYASLLHREDAQHALRRTMVPVNRELILSPGENRIH